MFSRSLGRTYTLFSHAPIKRTWTSQSTTAVKIQNDQNIELDRGINSNRVGDQKATSTKQSLQTPCDSTAQSTNKDVEASRFMGRFAMDEGSKCQDSSLHDEVDMACSGCVCKKPVPLPIASVWPHLWLCLTFIHSQKAALTYSV